MSEKCPKCKGKRVLSTYTFFCPTVTGEGADEIKCPGEIGEGHYTITSKTSYDEETIAILGTGSRYDDDVVAVCPECNQEYKGILGEMDYEERKSLCECSKDAFEVKIKLKEQLIQGHFPKETWDIDIRWYGEQEDYFDQNNDAITDLFSFTEKEEYRSIYNIYWLTGGTHSGITSLAVIFVKKLIELGNRAYFITMHNLLERSKDFNNKDYTADILKNDVIIIDDIFTPGKYYLESEFVIAQVYSFFKEAVSRNKLIVCTSSKRVTEISDKKFESIRELLKANAYEFFVQGTLSSTIHDEKSKKLAELRGKN